MFYSLVLLVDLVYVLALPLPDERSKLSDVFVYLLFPFSSLFSVGFV
jgi:hypothetical protein